MTNLYRLPAPPPLLADATVSTREALTWARGEIDILRRYVAVLEGEIQRLRDV
jgi:polyhydroxyalkanoate synthesis regulator phasin